MSKKYKIIWVFLPLFLLNVAIAEQDYYPILRSYEIDKNSDIWHAKDSSSYITPNNEWVKYYASQLYVDHDGRIYYKNIKVPAHVDEMGNVLIWTDRPYINNYVYDWEQFGTGYRGSLANDDYWANADYYLTHSMQGDCDEWMLAVTSMMLSGEMSTKEGDKFVKQVIPAKAVLGYIKNMRDGWVEYDVYGTTFITSTSREKKDPFTGEEQSATLFTKKSIEFKSVFEFTDKYFKEVE